MAIFKPGQLLALTCPLDAFSRLPCTALCRLLRAIGTLLTLVIVMLNTTCAGCPANTWNGSEKASNVRSMTPISSMSKSSVWVMPSIIPVARTSMAKEAWTLGMVQL